MLSDNKKHIEQDKVHGLIKKKCAKSVDDDRVT